MIATCSGDTSPVRCAAASSGRIGASGWPVMLCRFPTAAWARTRRDASPGESRSVAISVRTRFPWASTSGRLRRSASAISA